MANNSVNVGMDMDNDITVDDPVAPAPGSAQPPSKRKPDHKPEGVSNKPKRQRPKTIVQQAADEFVNEKMVKRSEAASEERSARRGSD